MLRAFFARAAAVAALCLPVLGCSTDKVTENVSSQTQDIGAAGASGTCTSDADCGLGCGVCNTGTGVCSVAPNTVTCRPAVAGGCDVAEQCDGVLPDCPGNVFADPSVVCHAGNGVCDPAKNCTGTSDVCPAPTLAPNTTVCHPSLGVCDPAEKCDGAGNCPTDAKLGMTDPACRPAAAGGCDVAEFCDGSGNDCPTDGFAANTVTCHTGTGICDPAKTCTGGSAACPAATLAPNTTVCHPSLGVCDPAETCNAGVCPADAKLGPTDPACRPSAGICDMAELCDGTSSACPTDAFVANTVTCHTGNGICDPAKTCTGSAAACPAPTLAPNTTPCRASNGVCDRPENCDGAGSCPADTKFGLADPACRPAAAGGCDIAEKCDGMSDACPADGFAANTVVCHTGNGVCDPAKTCPGGSAACPAPTFAPNTTPCRASGGICDKVENCDGVGACPADAKLGVTDPACRPAVAGGCDKPEFCDGTSNTCPAIDAKFGLGDSPCRPIKVGSLCDVAELCPGGTDICPPDAFANTSVVCRASATGKLCDVPESCPGNSPDCPVDGFADTSVVCRPVAGVCDKAEQCNGGSPDCPADGFQVNTVVCRPGEATKTECDPPELCTGNAADCPVPAYKPIGTACNDTIGCTQNDACDVNGSCVGVPTKDVALLEATCHTNDHTCAATSCTTAGCKYDKLSGLVCRPKTGTCDVAETCDGTSIDCPSDAFQPSTFTCQALACTNASLKPAVQCTGVAGACPTVADASCGNFACGSPTECRTTCVTSADCGDAFYCTNNTCLPRIGAGQACKTDAECSTSNNHCVDGVCCDTTCTGQCEACNTVGKVGTCVGVKGEPVSTPGVGGITRPKCTADGTKCDGFCDPSNRTACQFPSTTTSCSDAACDTGSNAAVAQSFCTGKGTCNTAKPTDCEPYSCGATACNGDCTADAQCASDAYCASGKCTKKGKQADACTTDKQCGSGHCADGVCCDTACNGQCEACNKVPEGKAGTCTAVTGKPLGARTACAATDAACAGACDGKNTLNCNYPAQGVVCRDGTCADGQATVASYCNGHGACPAALTISCEKGCEGSLCAGNQCILDSDCKDKNTYCAAGACTPKADPGSSCSSASACKTGFCTDGVCCDSACLGQCEACDASGSVGTCSAVPKGDSPHGGRTSCISDGSKCGGTCDGAARNACKYPFDTVCRAGSCAAGAGPDDPATSIVEATCIGNGRCPGEQEQLCGKDGCDGAQKVCNGACAVDKTVCQTGEYCSAGECVPKLDKAAVCANDAQCGSGFCVDGVCCNKRCADQCAACDAPDSVGTCTPVAGAAHGGRAACGGVGTCGAECDGKVIASCSFADDSVSCGDAFCSAGLKGDAPVCDGEGVCAPAKTTACASLGCDGTECSTACTADADCVKNFECRKGQCVAPVLIDAVDKGTCGCSMPGSASRTPASVLVLLGACALALSRRRRRLAA